MRQGAGTCSSIELLRGELRETECKEVVVEPFAVHQFAVGTCFHKAAFVQNEDAIGPLDRRETMGDDERGSAFHQLLQRLLDQSFRFAVER